MKIYSETKGVHTDSKIYDGNRIEIPYTRKKARKSNSYHYIWKMNDVGSFITDYGEYDDFPFGTFCVFEKGKKTCGPGNWLYQR